VTESSQQLIQRVARLEPHQAAMVLEHTVAQEEKAVLANRMKPYEDNVPKLLRSLPVALAAGMLEQVPTPVATRALFGNFSRIPDDRIRVLLAAMAPERAGQLIDAMAVGLDSPTEMARVLAFGSDPAVAPALAHSQPATLLRFIYELKPIGQASLMARAGTVAAQAVAWLLRASDNRVHQSWADWLGRAAEDSPGAASGGAVGGGGVDLTAAAIHGGNLRAALDQRSLDDAVAALVALHPSEGIRGIRLMGAERSAQLLAHLAAHDAALAADLLEAANRSILLRPPQVGVAPAWWLQECPGVAVTGALNLTEPASIALVRAMKPAQRELILDRLPAAARDRLTRMLTTVPGGHLSFSLDVMGVARGRRRAEPLDGGLRWVHIAEELDTGWATKPVVVDLLELPLEGVRLEGRTAVGARALPAGRAAEVFERFRQTGEQPEADTFAQLGLTQLSRAVAATDAIAAINGNFYFDYGHYINGVTLGIDIARVPGLFFGDPIGWFVHDGQEMIPPAVNRAAGIVTDDGRFHIERVCMTDVVLANGTKVTWDEINAPKRPGRTVAYTSIFGYRTEAADTHIDVAIARGKIWEMASGGDQVIPLTGFVLAVPKPAAGRLLRGVSTGDSVSVGHNFPARRGRVVEAMACGPSLVRDSAVDVDFSDEDFGQQDSTVMSFCLPRTMETYDAARSFMAVRDQTLILGAVSGTAYGYGRPELSGGMTFGELAQLCLDLGANDAYALDGGGSSSIVARQDGRVRVLNAPTGGADIGPGQERFINTYWLAFAR